MSQKLEKPVYHYTYLDKWPDIQKQGLQPRSRQSLASQLTIKDTPHATFALLDKEPSEWQNEGPFPQLWNEFKGTRGDLLLEIEVDPSQDQILVGDAGYIEGYLYRKHHDQLRIPNEYLIVEPDIAYEAYEASLIPLSEYLEDDCLSYLVPEVQIRTPVPPERIQIGEEQPLLEYQLGSGRFVDVWTYPLPTIVKFQSDLTAWLESVKPIAPNLEQSIDRFHASQKKHLKRRRSKLESYV